MKKTPTKRIIFYISPGHQCSEFVPWLINNSPEVTHESQWRYPQDWTRYESSWGVGYEPMESQWIMTGHNYGLTEKDEKLRSLRMRYKKLRQECHTFDPEWMSNYLEFIDQGTVCLFFNIDNPMHYEEWVTVCREWFSENRPEYKIEFYGHVMNLKNVLYPSLYFLKEGYIFDEKGITRDKYVTDVTVQRRVQDILEHKVIGRCAELMNTYIKLNFNYVFQLRYIEDRELCKRYLNSVITLPENFDDLYDFYYKFNPIDSKVDILTRTILNRFDSDCHVPVFDLSTLQVRN